MQGVLQIATLIGALASKRSSRRPPVVAAVYTAGNRDLKQELIDRLFYRRILRRLSAVIFVCENQMRHWAKKYPELKPTSHVVYKGVEPSRFRRKDFLSAAEQFRVRWEIPRDAVVFACIAAFWPEKGHDLLIKAFSRLESTPYLVFAGDGAMRPAIESLVRSIGVAERVKFLGNVPDVRPVIVASDATVLASKAVETFSIAMLESMALGVAMIAPAIGGLPEAIIHGESGSLSPVRDSAALQGCMRAIVENSGYAREMGDSPTHLLVRKFTSSSMVLGNEKVLEKAGRSP